MLHPMRKLPLALIAASGLLITLPACASQGRLSAPVGPAPRVPTPEYAKAPCTLYTRPAVTLEDLEIIAAIRGEQLLTCDEKRELAVLANAEQAKALDAWEQARAKRRCPWWRFGTCKPPDS